jgi:apolipoprotein D and lipocalin family protein
MKRVKGLLITLCAVLGLRAEASGSDPRPPLKVVDHVDVPRFMGSWHVIANIDNIFERKAYGSVETYTLREDGRIDVLFEFRKGSFDGPLKRMRQVAWVPDPAKSGEWRVQLLWPLRFPYLIIDLAPDYSWTVIGYPNRDLIWVMARTPTLPEATLKDILERAKAQGYDLSKIQRVPQRNP